MEIEGMEVVITRSEETVELSPTGELVRIAVYRYTLDNQGPYEVRLPLAQDTDENLIAGIKKKAAIMSKFK